MTSVSTGCKEEVFFELFEKCAGKMRLSRSRLLLTAAVASAASVTSVAGLWAICDCDSDCIFAKGLDHHNITVDSESINVLLTGRVSPWGKEGRKKVR